MDITPSKWWHWLLIYPTLVVSLLTGAPEMYRLYQTGGSAPLHSTTSALEQKNAWERNADCVMEHPMHEAVHPANNIRIGVRICPDSGDVQIRGFVIGGQAVYRWVALSTLLNQPASVADMFQLVPKAHASDMVEQQSGGQVLCQRMVQQGVLLQRIYYAPTNSCYDNLINVFTGQLLRSQPAPCNRAC